MPDILITEFMQEEQVERIKQSFDAAYMPDLVTRQDDIPALMAGVRGIIVRNQTQVRGALLDAADSLQCVGRLGVGLDNIDTDACAGRGIEVYPATGANSDSVAELALGAIFVMFRKSYLATPDVVAGQWPRLALMGREVAGKTLGIIGLGWAGRALAWRAKGVGMKTIAFDPYLPADHAYWDEYKIGRAATLNELLAASDAVSIHVPLTDETRNLIDADAIAKMKDKALLLNLSRGGIVDEQAMVDGLNSGKLDGAYTDVFVTEPVAAGSIFEGVPNLYLTPHIGPRTEEGETRVCTMIADAVMNHLNKGT